MIKVSDYNNIVRPKGPKLTSPSFLVKWYPIRNPNINNNYYNIAFSQLVTIPSMLIYLIHVGITNNAHGE